MRTELSVPLTTHTVRSALGIPCEGDARELHFIVTDSREAVAGDLFIAIGRGREYIADAARRGALTVGSSSGADIVCDGALALRGIAALCRRSLPCLRDVIGVTGSVGKTTVKEMLLRLLSPFCRVHGTLGNYNNLVGLPLSILSAPRDTEVLVLEMGMNAAGEIAELSRIAEPTAAVITSVGTSHIGRLGSREAIALAKLEIYAGLSGRLYGPSDEPLLAGKCGGYFAVGEPVGDEAGITRLAMRGGKAAVMRDGRLVGEAKIAFSEWHHLSCLAAAMSVAYAMVGDCAVAAMSEIGADAVRERYIRRGEVCIIDDCYNASLESMRAAMDGLCHQGFERRSALLGDVLELGDFAGEIHAEIGRYAAERLTGELWLIGDFALSTARGAVLAGFPISKIHIMQSVGECAAAIAERREREIILVKGSHGCCLSRVTEILKDGRKE